MKSKGLARRINSWLGSNFRQWDYDKEEEACYVIWFAIVSFVTLFVGQFVFKNVALMFSALCLGLTFVPPVVLGIRSIVKKEKFNPLYWFLGIKGLVYGGLLACVVLFAIRGIAYIVTTIF